MINKQKQHEKFKFYLLLLMQTILSLFPPLLPTKSSAKKIHITEIKLSKR